MHLMRHRLGVGHSLYMDNYYNSVPLAATLLRESTYCTGTLRADRKYLPEEVKTAVLKKGETVARYAQGIAVAKWKDKRTVLYISTEFENEMAVSHNRYGQPRQKPLAIIHYNAEMSGVDRHDQLMAYYPAEHKSLRWYKKVFVHILQMGFINAFRLYKKSNPATKKSLYDFRIDLVHALLPPKERLLLRPVQRNQNRHVISKIPKLPNKARVSRRRCKQCQTEGRETRTIYFCAQCDGEPGLCALACFDKWHA
ncbi:piggyBac transposable element-derived protein 4-like [Homalodisca vitripennis]|nr:piggyBac transposable element-derived protein 4-like [Homalodisca vitripennis]